MYKIGQTITSLNLIKYLFTLFLCLPISACICSQSQGQTSATRTEAVTDYVTVKNESEPTTSEKPKTYLVNIMMLSTTWSSQVDSGQTVKAQVLEQSVPGEPRLNSKCFLLGHIDDNVPPRSGWAAFRDTARKFKKNGAFKIVFDTLIMDNDKTVSIRARLLPQKGVQPVKHPNESKPEWRDLKVNKEGFIVRGNDTASPTLRKLIFAAKSSGDLAAESFEPIMPVKGLTSGIIDATVAKSTHEYDDFLHPRIEALFQGVIGTLPGMNIIKAVAYPGRDTSLRVGDKLLVELTF